MPQTSSQPQPHCPWPLAPQSTGGSGGWQRFLQCTLSVCLSAPGSHILAAKPQGAAHRRSQARAAKPSSRIWASSVSPTISEREGSPPASLDSPTGGEAAPQAGRVSEALSDWPAERFRVPKCPMQSVSFGCLWAELGLSMRCHPPGCGCRQGTLC